MRIFIALIALLTVQATLARDCGSLPSKIDNHNVYAEVISRGHMELELVAVKKGLYHPQIKITGGKGYNAQDLPDCNMDEVEGLEKLTSNISTNFTMDYSYHTAAYAICIKTPQGAVKESYTICNYEVGD